MTAERALGKALVLCRGAWHTLIQSCGCAGRRASKLTSLVVSLFSASYVRGWATHFPDTPLLSTPFFDGRAVLYPTDQCLRDYLSWRQVDTHINNQVRTPAPLPDSRLSSQFQGFRFES